MNGLGLIDLHMHSNHSDGLLSLEDLILHMKDKGLNVMSLTDHDTTSGVQEAKLLANEQGIKLISGVEITTRWKSKIVHILGLDIDILSNELQDLLKENQEIRINRAIEINKVLETIGYPGSLDYINTQFKPVAVGRLHFAKFLCDKRYVNGFGQAFKSILTKKSITDIEQGNWPLLEKVINSIHAAKGQSVIAHPLRYGLNEAQLKKFIESFAQCGGDGIEYISGKAIFKDVEYIDNLVKQFKLKASIGSDFHAPNKRTNFDLAKYCRWIKQYSPIWDSWGLQ